MQAITVEHAAARDLDIRLNGDQFSSNQSIPGGVEISRGNEGILGDSSKSDENLEWDDCNVTFVH